MSGIGWNLQHENDHPLGSLSPCADRYRMRRLGKVIEHTDTRFMDGKPR
jgi:hypothetical protein